jgi:protein-disulfide isomerase
MKKFVYIGLAVVAVIAAIVLSGGGKEESVAQPTNNVIGTSKSGVVLVEYADFQCPGCASFYPILKEIKERYKDEISFQFVNFPLSQIHPNAIPAHRAAHAASMQGKFWEMHDVLYENQTVWQSSTNIVRDLEAYATQIGLDLAKFKTDYASATTNKIIQADIKTGQDKNVTGTPTFFLDGKQIEDNNSIATVEKFSKLIEDAIEAKTGKRPNITTTEPATLPATQTDPNTSSN